jgi:hypothetical protein
VKKKERRKMKINKVKKMLRSFGHLESEIRNYLGEQKSSLSELKNDLTEDQLEEDFLATVSPHEWYYSYIKV